MSESNGVDMNRLVRGLRVNVRPLLVSGQIGCDEKGPVILIDSEQSRSEQNVTLWHEVVHLLRDAGCVDQSESEVEACAVKLAAACPDAIDWITPNSVLGFI